MKQESIDAIRQIVREELARHNAGEVGLKPGNLLSAAETCERLKVGRTTLWRMEKRGELLPTQISAGRVGWREDIIDRMLSERTAVRQ